MICRKCKTEMMELINGEWHCQCCAIREFKRMIRKMFPFKQIRRFSRWWKKKMK